MEVPRKKYPIVFKQGTLHYIKNPKRVYPMSTMETFHKLLCSTTRKRNQYLETLVSLTKVDLGRLSALLGDLGCQIGVRRPKQRPSQPNKSIA